MDLYRFLVWDLALKVYAIVPWTILFIFINKVVKLYVITSREECTTIQNKIEGFCSHSDGTKGHGYSIGKWYILYLHAHDGFYSCTMICTQASFEALTSVKKSVVVYQPQRNTDTLKIIERFGNLQNPYFRKRELEMIKSPSAKQQECIEMATSHFIENHSSVFLFHGNMNTGKTTTAMLLSKKINGVFCNSLNPWQPGDSIALAYLEIEPSPNKPLVILFDEFDVPLQKIHDESIPPHKNVPISVYNKCTWNRMLDEIQNGFYPYTILILATNKPLDFFTKMDPSYIRRGRVNLFCKFE